MSRVLDDGNKMYTALFHFFSLLCFCLSIPLRHQYSDHSLLLRPFATLVVPNRTGSITTTIPSSIERNDDSTDQPRI
jgi:hypothetical protein